MYVRCEGCGVYFETPPSSHHRRYCSPACKRKRLHDCNSRERTYQSRPLSELSVYLIHKYTAEGMTPAEIRRLLERPQTDLDRALATPLTTAQRLCLALYLAPRQEESR